MKVNGKQADWHEGITVQSLLEFCGHDPQRVAVEVSGKIVPRAAFAETALCDADSVEIVTFVGGG